MIKMYCYCVGDEVVYGPRPLPTIDNPIANGIELEGLSDDLLVKLGWRLWINSPIPVFDKNRFRLFSKPTCNEFFSFDSFYLEPLTEDEYIHFYNEKLNSIPIKGNMLV